MEFTLFAIKLSTLSRDIINQTWTSKCEVFILNFVEMEWTTVMTVEAIAETTKVEGR